MASHEIVHGTVPLESFSFWHFEQTPPVSPYPLSHLVQIVTSLSQFIQFGSWHALTQCLLTKLNPSRHWIHSVLAVSLHLIQ